MDPLRPLPSWLGRGFVLVRQLQQQQQEGHPHNLLFQRLEEDVVPDVVVEEDEQDVVEAEDEEHRFLKDEPFLEVG
jgi:hypothetical protein